MSACTCVLFFYIFHVCVSELPCLIFMYICTCLFPCVYLVLFPLSACTCVLYSMYTLIYFLCMYVSYSLCLCACLFLFICNCLISICIMYACFIPHVCLYECVCMYVLFFFFFFLHIPYSSIYTKLSAVHVSYRLFLCSFLCFCSRFEKIYP